VTNPPELYTRILEEGRTTAQVKALLEDIFRPDDLFSLDAVHLNVSDDLPKDVKELNFGYNNDLSYESSHRGISPFTVISISMTTASRQQTKPERYSRTSNLTLSEVTTADMTPVPCRTNYFGMMNLLRRYVTLLQKSTGNWSGHHVEVRPIMAELNNNQHIFESLDSRQCTSILWQIFMDSRHFFLVGIDVRGNLPQSLLRTTYNEVAPGIDQTHLNVPYAEVLGKDLGVASHELEAGTGDGGRTQMGAKTFRHVPAAIKTILRGARSKYLALTIADLMGAHESPLQYAQVKMGPDGACVDFLCFGSCKNSRCSYKHTATASIVATRAEAVAPKLKAAYKAYNAGHT
jgi:hypothetical protein